MSRLAVAAVNRVVLPFLARAGVAAVVVGGAVLGHTAPSAQPRDSAAAVIVACDHGGRTSLATRVTGIEAAGRLNGLVPALEIGSSCAETVNVLTRERFELVHRLSAEPADYDGDGDVDGRDFLIWQRGGSPAQARSATRERTVLLRCEYVLAERFMTRVAGSEVAGAIDASLALLLATRPSCAEAYVALADAGLRLVSAAPAPAGQGVTSTDLAFWGDRVY